jgi:predicted ATPase
VRNINKVFSPRELEHLKKIGIVFEDGKDYSENEIAELYEQFEDSEENDLSLKENDEPTSGLLLFEAIHDKFQYELGML